MNNKEKLVISKLLKIAENQQKIITKLAQTVEGHDPVIDYINNRLVAVIAANLGLQGVTAETAIISGLPANADTDGSYHQQESPHYNTHVAGVPEPKRPEFSQAFMKQLSIQKPNLTDKVSLFFDGNKAASRLQSLRKVSQMAQQDPVIEYLMRAIPTAAANVGINNVVVTKVDKHDGQSGDNVATPSTYTAQITGISGKQGDIFKQSWDKQLAAQKPDLVGRVSFFFAG